MGVSKFVTIVIVFIIHNAIALKRAKWYEDAKPTRDYRPSKWVSNSLLDVWFGNKSMVDILSREFTDVIDRIALRPVRSLEKNKEEPIRSKHISIKDEKPYVK